MQPFKEEWSSSAPQSLLLQDSLPLPRMHSRRGVDEEEGTGLAQPYRRIPPIF